MMETPKVEQILTEHNLYKEFCNSADDVQILQGVLDIIEDVRKDHFIVGTLATESCFSVTPVTAVSLSQKTILAIFYLGSGLSAASKGLVHGGVVATIMDESCARAALTHIEVLRREAAKKEKSSKGSDDSVPTGAVTSQLKIQYLAPMRTNSCVIVKASVEPGASERKAKVTAKMWNLGDGEDVLAASAESQFVRPKL